MENPAGDLVQDERLVGDVHGVPGIRAPLIAHYPVRALSENVDELAFAFVSPLGADYDNRTCVGIEH